MVTSKDILKRFLVSILVLIVLSFSALAQGLSEYDSLKIELSNKHTPLEKHFIYDRLILLQYSGELDNEDDFVARALTNAKRVDGLSDSLKSKLYKDIGIFYYNKNMFEKAHRNLDKALTYIDKDIDSVTYSRILYNKAAAYSVAEEFEKSIKYSRIALQHLPLDKRHHLRTDLRVVLANAYRDLGLYRDAIDELQSALAQDVSDDPETRNVLLSSAGRLFMTTGEYDSAAFYHKKAIAQGKRIQDKRFLASTYNNMGNTLETSGNLTEALLYYIKSLELKEKAGEPKSLAIAHLNVGSIQSSLGKYGLAQENFYKSLSYAKAANSDMMLAYGYVKLGNILSKTESLDSAVYYHKLGLEKSKSIKFGKGLVESHFSLAQDYRLQGDIKKSYSYYKKTLQLAEDYALTSNVSAAHTGIAELYLANRKLEPSKRELIFDQREIETELVNASEHLVEINNMNGIVTSLNALRQFYHYQRNSEKEALYAAKYITYKDSLYSTENAKAIAQWETKYNTAEKDKEITLLEKDAIISDAKAKRRLFLTVGLALLTIAIGVIGLVLYNQLKLKEKLKMERFRNKIAADLHDDVGSTLSSISMYSEVILQKTKDAVPETAPMLRNMASNSREIVEAMGDIVWTINPNNNTINSLISRVRSKSASLCEAREVRFKCNSDDIAEVKMNLEAAQNVYLVLKESINNALKYSECKNLTLETKVVRDVFQFNVIDNGKGFDLNSESSGNGMRTMKERMEEIGGSLSLNSSSNGTVVKGEVKL